MKALSVSEQKRFLIVNVIRERCSLIGRSWLQDITPEEVTVVIKCKTQEVFVCIVDGMRYEVCIKESKERIGIFDPTETTCRSGSGIRIKGGFYSNAERH